MVLLFEQVEKLETLKKTPHPTVLKRFLVFEGWGSFLKDYFVFSTGVFFSLERLCPRLYGVSKTLSAERLSSKVIIK